MLENYVIKTPGVELIDSFTDPVMALSAIRDKKPDLVFLDIQMPDLSGLDLSRMVPDGVRIIFTTAFKQYALDSYDVFALDFLLKPIRYQKFLEAVDKGKAWFSMKDAAEAAPTQEQTDKDSIFLKTDKVLQKISLSDILYVEGMKDYALFHLGSQERPLMAHITMKAVEDMLPAARFMRVHRSFIVALDKIDSVQPGLDIMIGRTLIHVSEAYRDVFAEYLKSKSL
ncbi:MAG: LytTR family DNA-binding domain-containing protein, partial [Bacteroidia bacterium]|nr:LytTR family DNA-binding domain-containing protein [Bacteroidia bacterium]